MLNNAIRNLNFGALIENMGRSEFMS
jgi:hypothetical protein